jgi:hypothetical protein
VWRQFDTSIRAAVVAAGFVVVLISTVVRAVFVMAFAVTRIVSMGFLFIGVVTAVVGACPGLGLDHLAVFGDVHVHHQVAPQDVCSVDDQPVHALL